MDKLVLRNSKKRNVLLLLGCGVFVAMGIFIVLKDHSSKAQMVGWANILFFGLGMVVACFALADTRPRITIDEHGITDRTLKVGLIEWADITGATVYSINATKFIGLDLVDEEKYLSRIPNWQTKMAAANEMLGFHRINLNLAGISINANELAEMIVAKAGRKHH
jgi:hypothetical protein